MQKPICVSCKLYYKPEKNGFPYIEGMPTNNSRNEWEPYKLWIGDKWKCKGCGHQIIIAALNRVSEHYESDFDHMVEVLAPTIQINDC